MKFIKLAAYLLLIFTMYSCSIFNSGNVHLKYTTSKAKFNNVSYENENRMADISISVKKVQHPKNHGPWDFNLGITPSIHFDRQKYSTNQTFINSNSQIENYEDILVKRGLVFFNIGATTHTPIGQFVIKAGFGGELYEQRGEFGFDTIKTREVRKIDFNYIGFFSERFFILMGPRYLVNSYEQFIFAFRVGFFWGAI